ncbi:hypothetical protein GALMADRAFT_134646 [Galerina marginata CBS 339.88]|uniref:CxC2-like cysteine cluster KDZ transposase-associated domain-containing protein n=1 Tax=Galerina marginata (strain CBS 339.88) TaxID=685588 RepID=A0A067TJ15_GALM3|nr:hypothetical protein GALMADRAFT_134646 [Galerina marginata CBS 339.88]
MSTSSRRPAKRPRTNNDNVYHHSIPFNDDIDVVFSRDNLTRRVNDSVANTPAERIPQTSTSKTWNAATSWAPQDDPEFALDADGGLYNEAVDGDIACEVVQVPTGPPKRSKVAKRPNVVWMETHRQHYLDEIMRWEGRGDFMHSVSCPDCASRKAATPGPAEYRCVECFLPDLLCSSCCVKRHRLHPFHRIKKWTGTHFIKTSLKDIGLKVQLNHASLFCESPIPCHVQMRVLHVNGIHDVAIQYCGCSRTIPQHLQLLRRGFYPATQLTVKTCATFELLSHLHILALTSKASTYDFYHALERMSESSGINRPSSRYRALFRIIMQWRHLKMLKWAGRGNDSTGVSGTQLGELAIRCPSCPYPGINLPTGWENAPPEMKFLYMLFICMDANFRLKNQLVSNYSQDPGLGNGWAYMIPRVPYERYVLSRANDEDIHTCVGLQALAKANTKYSKGLRYTGVGGVVCGRSEMVMPLGVGNLQKGERYPNMDYIFGSVIRLFLLIHLILISYDISCQWIINLLKRHAEHWPPEIQIPETVKLIPAIPKLHEPSHSGSDHQTFSFNTIPGVGETDGECIERLWGPHNILGNATKTQGPGSRQDVLDDHFNFWNWEKYVGFGRTLARKFKAAVALRNIQAEGHRGLTEALDSDLVAKWDKMCVEWESEGFKKTKKNPYQTDGLELTEAQAKKELAEEEGRRLAAGGVALHATGPSAFLVMGLDIEDTQRRVRRLAKDQFNLTLTEKGTLADQRNQLTVRIRAWERLQAIYMPGLLQYRTDLIARVPTAADVSEYPEDAELWLPSKVSVEYRAGVCIAGLPDAEERLRTAQCYDALENVRHILKIKSRMVHFKNKNVRGQRDGTRSRSVIDGVHERARAAAAKYRAARSAKMKLSGPGDWELVLQDLLDTDLRSYQDPSRLRVRQPRKGTLEDDQMEVVEDDVPDAEQEHLPDEPDTALYNEPRTRRDGTGETRRTLSWIWVTQSRTPDAADETDDILRSEWAKSRARALRAKEEVLLIKEEMRRTLEYLKHQVASWTARSTPAPTDSKELAEGRAGFARCQASLQEALHEHFITLWRAPLSVDDDNGGNNDGKADEDDNEGDDEELDEDSRGYEANDNDDNC